jgi:hypothetical protein
MKGFKIAVQSRLIRKRMLMIRKINYKQARLTSDSSSPLLRYFHSWQNMEIPEKECSENIFSSLYSLIEFHLLHFHQSVQYFSFSAFSSASSTNAFVMLSTCALFSTKETCYKYQLLKLQKLLGTLLVGVGSEEGGHVLKHGKERNDQIKVVKKQVIFKDLIFSPEVNCKNASIITNQKPVECPFHILNLLSLK